ncbi:Ribonuclease H1, N-terminal [Trema orientale]|uniref:Ribonuclease H1, N-terminal n=1 Tax=Trema orientale TaxID=63057 RepID=A0A2P5F7Q3_TREOI|nr:Ribonuclease H1, N-terminal [Trema orientale]
MGRKRYYVVYIGRNPGIYDSWEACHHEVSGFHGNLYRGFMSLQEAIDSYQAYTLARTRTPHMEPGADRRSMAVRVSQVPSASSHGERARNLPDIVDVFAMGCMIGALASTMEGRDNDGASEFGNK